MQLLAFPNTSFKDLSRLDPSLEAIDAEVQLQMEREALYANYIDRQQKDADLLKKDEAVKIPPDFDYDELAGLSNELTSKLNATRPDSIAQVSRIDGMTPAALTLILAKLRQTAKKRSA